MRNTSALLQVAPRLALTWANEWLDHHKPRSKYCDTTTEAARKEASATS